MSNKQQMISFKVPDGTTELYNYNLEDATIKSKGIILFLHGFNSSYKIWGDFIKLALDKGYIPFAINFSNPIDGSIENLALHDLSKCVNFLRLKFSFNEGFPLHFVAHSMGGIVLRYYLNTLKEHYNYFFSAALLGVPNHGISKSTSKNLVSKIENIVTEINKLKKINIKLTQKAYFQLLSGNSIISDLNNNLENNLWSTMIWMNFIGDKDVIVASSTSEFLPEEISFLKNNFIQKYFDCTHMKNPISLFTSESNFLDVFEKIENIIPEFGYLTKHPLYSDPLLIKEYFSILSKLKK